jgi:hypothetical protein
MENLNNKLAGLTYFATDGSYGDASDLAIVDTSEFTEEDWEAIEAEHDWHKPGTAEAIAKRIAAK